MLTTYDSVGSIKETKVLISDIDDILALGGFCVKKWVCNVPVNSDKDPEEVVLGEGTHRKCIRNCLVTQGRLIFV